MSILHEWDAEQVSNDKLPAYLAAGWEPLGMAQMTMFDGLGRPAGAAVFWAVRRRRPRVDLSLLTPPQPESGEKE